MFGKKRLTKRAPDAGDSAAISGSFLRLFIFLVGRLRRPRPSAGTHRASRKPLARQASVVGKEKTLSFLSDISGIYAEGLK